jgi:DUF4097 and DUF4098 domain-containing protein YvlB
MLTMMTAPRSRHARAAALILPLLLAGSAGCDVITADLKHTEKAEWRRSYDLAPGGRVEISNVNGKIDVTPSDGQKVEIVAVKSARGATQEAAKQALERAEIGEDASRELVRVVTRIARGNGGWFHGDSIQVEYAVKVPAAAEVKFTTINGGVELTGLSGRITAETTNGGVAGRDVSGSIEASTTNGRVDVELLRLAEGGARLGCTNGGVRLRLPADAKATISASVTNGGIETSGLQIDATQTTRRRLEGKLNGGGAAVKLECTNGGISINAR